MHLVCAGGTFAPANALLSSSGARDGAEGAPLIEGFTQRQAQILDCLRRGMANKLIAYELNMCESTVKVHIRNIMKKLKATNRTQVVYLTNGFFEGGSPYRRAGLTRRSVVDHRGEPCRRDRAPAGGRRLVRRVPHRRRA